MNKQPMVKPNKLEVAKNQMSKFEGLELPTQIKECDADRFHVALVRSVPNPATMKFDNTLKIQQFDTRSWEVSKKNLALLGYQHHFILHDPSEGSEKVEAPKAEAKPEATPEAPKAEAAGAEATGNEGNEGENAGSDSKPTKASEIEGFFDLKEFAADLGMPVGQNTKKAEIMEWISENSPENL